jgi:hypothetical protein
MSIRHGLRQQRQPFTSQAGCAKRGPAAEIIFEK